MGEIWLTLPLHFQGWGYAEGTTFSREQQSAAFSRLSKSFQQNRATHLSRQWPTQAVHWAWARGWPVPKGMATWLLRLEARAGHTNCTGIGEAEGKGHTMTCDSHPGSLHTPTCTEKKRTWGLLNVKVHGHGFSWRVCQGWGTPCAWPPWGSSVLCEEMLSPQNTSLRDAWLQARPIKQTKEEFPNS